MDTIDMRHHWQSDEVPKPASNWQVWGKRLAWLVLIWTLSVSALALLAGAMRLLMHALGMR
ncbi:MULTISPECIES: DUF2474 domain-containing protein [unclassified Undibacterium]|uniref:DUF2474 domain-containing protein n=1 Tax=unclassified Undibacterium TaxID=2630295 RepID=UPI002AC9AC59|nr:MULTISPECIES: DUF2474 domain-containing protein [unclassified Undibacterium]WPX43818.1 DUF2474 domain-containing protein [Undibacterium sp. CCC3.4]